MKTKNTPVVFIHGFWLHASSWQDWIDYFETAGYEVRAPGWPGEPISVEKARQQPELVAGKGLDEVTENYAQIIRSLKTKPIVIGHSFGGLIAQKLLGQDLAAAVVAINAVQPKGVWRQAVSQFRAVSGVLANPFNINRAVIITPKQFRYAFTNTVSPEKSLDLYNRWVIPSPAKSLFTAAIANLNPDSSSKVNINNSKRGPLLLIGGGRDHTIPASLTGATYRLYKRKSPAITEIKVFTDRGHSLIIDQGWREIADYSLDWLKSQNL
jgi:pimeloyl-ACP methyl ester carboxylesterase